MQSESPRIYSVFIASPGDVTAERKIAFAVIEDLNKSWENLQYPAKLKCLSWEKSVPAGAGKPQEVIKEKIDFTTLDIFIAILWKRLGTPTMTNRPRDNKPYLSGTQQEIEEAYDCWKHRGHPVIMLYRKDDNVPANMSGEEINQFKLVNDFLRQFEPHGESPALIKHFKKSEFKQLLKRELAQTISGLIEAPLVEGETNSLNLVSPNSVEGRNQMLIRQPEPATEDTMEKWLKDVRLRENPFRHQDAEHDASLPNYFTRFPDLHAVTTSDLTSEHKTWFFFGKEGSGKTALRRFISARGRPHNSGADAVCIEYDQVKFEHLLNNIDDLSDFQYSFIRSIFEAVSEFVGGAIQSSPPLDSLRGNLPSLSVALRGVGINWVLCLIDPGKPSFEWKGSQVLTSSLITPLFSLSEIGGYGFRYFLPRSIKDELKPTFSRLPFNHIRVMNIKWDDRTLKDMLGKRMIQSSMDQTAPYRSLGELCEDEQNLSSLVDTEISNLALGNPRGAVWLANRLIELHSDSYPSPSRITLETWNNVKKAWSSHGESRILGTSRHQTFKVLSNRIYYMNWEIVLPERSDRLLKSLILAMDGFRSKEELIQAGWKDEKNLQGISEKALSEAMRRMKEELKKELKSKGFEDLKLIKSVRSRGYRLWQPNISEEQEGEND
jgi:DNA-binding winged helix-turn-helix (wHTH) protein